MTTARTLALALAFSSASVLVPRLAAAQPAPAARAQAAPAQAARATGRATQAPEETNTEYRFEDDDLLGGGLDGTMPVIRVNPRASRSLLIRPRTSFVPELLVSAEGL